MTPMVVYSVKLDPAHIDGARKFFLRGELPIQEALRAQVKMASDCERCLELVEAQAPVEQIQTAFANILADAKETFHLSGLFRDAILKTAEVCGLPENFIANVLAESERIPMEHTQIPDKSD